MQSNNSQPPKSVICMGAWSPSVLSDVTKAQGADIESLSDRIREYDERIEQLAPPAE